MTWVNLCKPNALNLSLHIVPAHLLFNRYVWWMWSSKCQRISLQNKEWKGGGKIGFFLIKNPDVFILYSIRVSVSSGTSMSCFCSLKTEYCIFLLTLCGMKFMKLNVSISENMQKRRGKRLQRKRAGKEWGGGLSHGAHEGETNRDRPAASPLTDALILTQKRSDFPSQR